MAGLFVVGDATFNSLATGSILVVAVAVLGSITVLPALLVKLGRWVDRPRVPLLWRLNRRIGRGGISSRLLAPGACGTRVVALRRSPASSSSRSRVPALGHEDPLRQPRHAARPRSRRCRRSRRSAEAFPATRAPRPTVVVQVGRRPADAGGRGARATSTDEAVATGDFVASGRERSQTSADGTTSVLALAHAVRRDRPAGRRRARRELRDDLVPAALDGARRGVRRRRRRRRVAGLRRPAAAAGCRW